MFKKLSYKEAVLKVLKDLGRLEDNSFAKVRGIYDRTAERGGELIDFADLKLTQAREALQQLVRGLPGE